MKRLLTFVVIGVMCGGGFCRPAGPPDPDDCSGPMLRGPIESLELGRGADGTFIPLTDGEEVQMTWGPQGGIMLAFRLRYYTGIVTYFINVTVYYFIWRAIYAADPNYGGMDFPHMVTYVAVGWTIRSLYFNNIDSQMATDILEGKISMVMLKPVSIQWSYIARALGESASLAVTGHDIEVAWTPGHASHHVTFFLPAARLAFVGDTAGLCRPVGRLVIPPTPPPDIDLEAWRASTDRILAWQPETIFLTHFGPQGSPERHFELLWERIDDWSARVRASLDEPGSDADRAERFQAEVADQIARVSSRGEAESYQRAGRFDYSWAGLARYWRKKAEAAGPH